MRWLPLLLIVLLAVAAALQIGRRSRHAGDEPGATPSGAALYAHYCAECHLANGAGRNPAADLRRSTWSDAELRRVVTHGVGRMPRVPVGGARLDSLVRYVRSGL